MNIKLLHSPTFEEQMLFKTAVWTTMGKSELPSDPPSFNLLHKCLEARHSPIRELHFVFLMREIPSNTATHFVRHVHAQPYVSSLRNDRQTAIDGDLAPRNTPVDMMLSVNAEELMVMANKRLCTKAAQKTREVMQEMCRLASDAFPAISDFLVPMCEYCGGVCHEIESCGRCDKAGHWIEKIDVEAEDFTRRRFYCSVCGKWQTYGRTDYCPRCGAKMDEVTTHD